MVFYFSCVCLCTFVVCLRVCVRVRVCVCVCVCTHIRVCFVVLIHAQWRDNLFDCCGVDGPSSYCMACMFPVCTPCLFAKISSRISFGVAGLSTWGPTTFKQWLRFLSVFAFIYIFCSFNYSIFEHLASEEYYNDVAKSPYNGGAGHYHVQISDETKELYAWAQVFDVGTVLMTTVFCVLLMILRQRVRQRFLIPTMCETRAGENPCCGILEDFACMTFCQVRTLVCVPVFLHACPKACARSCVRAYRRVVIGSNCSVSLMQFFYLMRTGTCAYMYVYIHAYIQTQSRRHAHAHSFIQTNTHTHIHTQKYARSHTHTHKYFIR